ncbi:cytochrome P450 2B11-like isoform X2 [Pteropus medius]|uniref:cytochrome P450 2B11-like isoform X2 n=1 Tax=Pteropus vampyrus TaxID=132908 RepID=UPI00196B1479|nr:cytochrome P450 2B11-like isoform X2 [Pteropus giganteus]
MELSVLLLLALLTGLLLLLAKRHTKAHGRLPPGPRPLPFFGNVLQMGRRGLLKFLLQQRDKYGDVFTVYLGSKPVVMLCGIDSIREALVDQAEAFSGRGRIAAVDRVFQGYGALQDPTFLFHSITANIICSIVFGKRFAYSDPEFLRLLDLFYQSFVLSSSFPSQMLEFLPDIFKSIQGTQRQIYRNLEEVKTFIGRSVEKHRETLDPSAPQDLIDTYLLRMDKEKSDPGSEFQQANLIHTVLSLFFAGTETTSTTLRYGFLLMLKYPHIAERVHKEIDQVIGSHRPPALADRAKMPYTEAVLHEIQRFADLVPIGVPHKVTKDTYFRGYMIPQGTEVYPILNSALYDPRYFETPDTFNPDHFLDASGAVKKNEAFIPFSIGKRICVGESIARAELFLFFTTILQNFSVASPVAPEDIDLTPRETGVGKVPPVYQIRFLSR